MVDKATRLQMLMEKHLNQLAIFDKSDKGTKAREKASKTMTMKRPDKEFLKGILKELRAATYTDKVAKITESATLHFDKPVDTTIFTDYTKYVDTPMDLETIAKKIDQGVYVTAEDFEYDVSLVFKNCERYNLPKKNVHMLTIGKHAAKLFR